VAVHRGKAARSAATPDAPSGCTRSIGRPGQPSAGPGSTVNGQAASKLDGAVPGSSAVTMAVRSSPDTSTSAPQCNTRGRSGPVASIRTAVPAARRTTCVLVEPVGMCGPSFDIVTGNLGDGMRPF